MDVLFHINKHSNKKTRNPRTSLACPANRQCEGHERREKNRRHAESETERREAGLCIARRGS
jgi:hypothetical protein